MFEVKEFVAALDLSIVSQDPLCASAPLTHLDEWITPVERFFVRNHFSMPELDVSSWGLTNFPDQSNKDSLRPQYLPPGQHPLHQRPHAQLAGDGQGLVQQRDRLRTIIGTIALTKGIGVIAAAPGQLRPVASLPAKGQGMLEVGHRILATSETVGH